MTNINGSFQDTIKDPQLIPAFNNVTERDFMEFSNMPEIENAIVNGVIDDIAFQYAKFIREQGYGAVVRESIARLSLYIDTKLNDLKSENIQLYAFYKETQRELDRIRLEFEQAITAQTIDGEVKLARIALDGKVYSSLKARLDAIESRIYPVYKSTIKEKRVLIDDKFSLNNKIAIKKKINTNKSYDDLPVIKANINDDKQGVMRFVQK